MPVNTPAKPSNALGSYLRECRSRLKPDLGGNRRRRTPGLRREEVATPAGVSITWYTWLEQGRGGPPSAEVLERLAQALELDPDHRFSRRSKGGGGSPVPESAALASEARRPLFRCSAQNQTVFKATLIRFRQVLIAHGLDRRSRAARLR